jgi:hypothetical protein
MSDFYKDNTLSVQIFECGSYGNSVHISKESFFLYKYQILNFSDEQLVALKMLLNKIISEDRCSYKNFKGAMREALNNE